jgi:hypothetical protein
VAIALAAAACALKAPATLAQSFEKCSSSGAALFGPLPQVVIPPSLSDAEAHKVINDIVNLAGLSSNILITAGNVPNAAAYVCEDDASKRKTRIIMYELNFMQRIKQDAGTDWSAFSILAHEIGHHANGHFLTPYGKDPVENHRMELDADKFSGFIMARRGRTLDEAKAVMATMATPCGTATVSLTHPCREKRLDAIADGYKLAAGTGSAAAGENPASGAGSGPGSSTGSGTGTGTGTGATAAAPKALVDDRFVMRQSPNSYFEGHGYDKSETISLKLCEQRCLADARCRAVEFQETGAICQLYDVLEHAQNSEKVHLSYKVLKTANKFEFGMDRVASRYFEEHGFDKTEKVSLAACEARCLKADRCQAIEYQSKGQVCQLYDRVHAMREAAGTTISMKRLR